MSQPLLLPDTEPGASGGLTGPQKAAVILRILAEDGITLSIRDLPEPVQAELIRQTGDLEHCDPAVREAVVEEFVSILEDGGAGGIGRGLRLLGGSVSPNVAQKLRLQAGLPAPGNPWEKIGSKSVDVLVPVLEAESIEVAAVILSKIDVTKAAECLGRLSGERARRIAYAVSRTSAVTPDAVRRIGMAVAATLEVEPVTAFDDNPVDRVGAILNRSRAATRDEVLDGLDQTDAKFAGEVRKAIFTFANIRERVAPEDLPKVLRPVEREVLLTALAGAEPTMPEVVEYVLGGMSKRMSEALREEIAERGTPTEEEGETAMAEIVAGIREMEAAGEIYLTLGDD